MARPERLDALVVGAGPAGLATSRELARRGVAHTVLERGPDDSVSLDERGFVSRRDRVVVQNAPGLFVVGHNYDATGGLFNIRRDAPLAARLIAQGDG